MRKILLGLTAMTLLGCGRDDVRADAETAIAASDTMAGVVDSAPATVARGVAVLLTDENILAVLDTAYDVMLETDQLAQDRTDSDAVRQFATRSVTQNATARRAISATAQRLSVSPVLPHTDHIEGHADAMAMMRQRAGTRFDEIYLDHSTEVRREILEKIDDALDDETRGEPVKVMLRQLKTQIESDLKTLESLAQSGS